MNSMKITREQVKEKLSEALAKHGATLDDFESALAGIKSGDLTKQAALEKKGFDLITALSKITELLGTGAMMGGGAAGLAGYAGYKGIQDSEDKVNGKKIEQQQYNDAIQSLQSAVKKKQTPGTM